MTIRILVVDDEPLAREGVVFQLRSERDVEIVAECENGNAAIRAIRDLKPDLVFLDIRMPKVSGFDVIAKVGAANMPLVIFLTAYDEHAVEAFALNALDYLLKPLEKNRFQESLTRARTRLLQNQAMQQREQLEGLLVAISAATQKAAVDSTAARDSSITGRAAPMPDAPPRIAIKLSGQIHFLHPDEIDWVESEGDYVSVHVATRSHLVRETMQTMEKRLDSYGFARIHRSAIVNLAKISKLVASDHGDYEAQLSSGLTLKIGRNYREALFVRLKIEA